LDLGRSGNLGLRRSIGLYSTTRGQKLHEKGQFASNRKVYVIDPSITYAYSAGDGRGRCK